MAKITVAPPFCSLTERPSGVVAVIVFGTWNFGDVSDGAADTLPGRKPILLRPNGSGRRDPSAIYKSLIIMKIRDGSNL